MFGISPSEMLLILVLALLFFGGKRIPELARSLGRGVSEFKKGVRSLEDEITSASDEQKPVATPSSTPVAQPQPFRFDPYTGKPVGEAAPQAEK